MTKKRHRSPEPEPYDLNAPDAWERFEKAVDVVVKAGPQHRKRDKAPRLMDYYNSETGYIEIPDGLQLKFVSPDDTIGSRLRANIRTRSDSKGTAP